MRYTFVGFVLVMLVLVIGCSKNTKVGGKVTFDDGSPLTTGEVRFESTTVLASGKIQSDGSYLLGSTSAKDGVPNGLYKVSVYAMGQTNAKPEMNPADVPPAQPLVAKKFLLAETSGLTCEVKGSTTYDIKVEPFK